MDARDFKVGIVGAGWIAEKAAITLNGLEGFRPYAIGSRSLEKAQAFAGKWGVERAYGSYSEVIDDPEVDLLYVATPHSHHFDITREALEKGKPCLVEKAFMANKAQAQVVVDLARRRKVFLAEAIWTRYQPAVPLVRKLIREGRIGTPSGTPSTSLPTRRLPGTRSIRPSPTPSGWN
ncbi:MAG: Gfo/Idh/MocA family oxidoreductase [Bacteroidales bacterium]|nr:Gfo/Idh/MocA family oxidoreductase [Bacteroidales bacterium]